MEAITRREAMKTALKAGAYAAPVILGSTQVAAANGQVSGPQSADLAVTKTASIATPTQGSNVTFTVTVTNNGPSQATGVTIADALPTGLTFVSANPSAGTAYTSATGLWAVGTLANTASARLQLVATASGPVGTGITNTASVSHSDQSDPNGGNNSQSVTVTPRARGPGGFVPAPGSPFLVGGQLIGIVAGDFNGDGKLDLAVTDESNNNVIVLLGDGSGGFTNTPGSPFAVGTAPVDIVAGDFNGDGKLDLAITNRDSNTVSVLLGNGNGGFANAPGSPIPVGTKPEGIAVGDFNGDSKLDLAVANVVGNNVSVLLGNGSGGFTNAPGSPFAVGGFRNPSDIAVGDFNGDGKLDLAIASIDVGQDVSVFLGNGNGSFTPGSTYPIGGNPSSIVTVDLNGDGKLDLATADGGGDAVSVLLGNGNGGFTIAPNAPAGNIPADIAAGDFNGDSKLDLAVANIFGNNVSVLLGNGSGGFTNAPGSPFAVGAAPAGIVAADFNGDGKLDLAVAQFGGVSVLLQQ